VTDLTSEEQQALRKLAALSEPVPESKITGIPSGRRAEIIQALARRSDLIEVIPPQGRVKKPRYRLTPQGRELAALLPPEPPKRTPRAPSPPRPTVASLAASLEGLRAQLASLETRVSRLEAGQPSHNATLQPETAVAGMNSQEFRRSAREAFEQLDRTGRTLGVVPIPDLRRALGPRLTQQQFDEHLLQLHRDGTISLLPYDHPMSLPDDRRRDALHHPKAGLLYFVRWLTP
jgi:hypothetical protein